LSQCRTRTLQRSWNLSAKATTCACTSSNRHKTRPGKNQGREPSWAFLEIFLAHFRARLTYDNAVARRLMRTQATGSISRSPAIGKKLLCKTFLAKTPKWTKML
jgi:hypothetical protein